MPEPSVREAILPERGLPPFAALRAFEALVRLGGVRSAGRSLGINHSAVSRHVMHLEAWLGVALMERVGKRFELRDEARDYYARISGAIAEIGLATRELVNEEATRPLRIWCSPGLTIQWLASEIADFEKRFPNFRIALKPSETPANLHVHEADVNIYFHLDDSPKGPAGIGLKGHALARPEAIIAASPELARQFSGIRSPGEVLDLPLLHGSQKDDWRLWFARNHVDAPAELPGEMCWHPNMAIEAARLGRGVLLANRYFLERYVARGELVELTIPDLPKTALGAYYFVAREDRWSMPAMAVARSFLGDRMKLLEGA